MSVSFLQGDVFEVLRGLPSDHFDCVVTSPPYWRLRDYGVGGQIGLERSLSEHLDVMVRVFDEFRRVLKPTGTCWVNYRDCYAKVRTAQNGRVGTDSRAGSKHERALKIKDSSRYQLDCTLIEINSEYIDQGPLLAMLEVEV